MINRSIKQILCIWLVIVVVLSPVLMPTANAAAASSEVVMLDIPWELINNCGHQVVSGPCQSYSYAYCRIILDKSGHRYTEFWTGKQATNPSVARYISSGSNGADTEQQLLAIVYNNINMGRPIIVRVNGHPQHYVVAIGYNKNCNPAALTTSDFYIIDPANHSINSTAGSTNNYTCLDRYTLKRAGDKNQFGYFYTTESGVATTNSAGLCLLQFDSAGGSTSTSSLSVVSGTTLYTFPTPVRNGYTFDGWYTAKTGGSRVSTDYKITSDLTLYAHWTAIEPSIGSGTWILTVPANYKLLCYDGANSTASNGIYVRPQNSAYKITCSQKSVLSNGTVRYYGSFNGGTNHYWFTFDPAMSVSPTTTDTTKTNSDASTLRIDADSYPVGNLKKGLSFPLSGTVSSNYTITSFSGKIVRNDGTIMCSASQTVNAKSLSIRRSNVDMNLKFSSLDDGYYYLVYEATDNSGRTALWQSVTFTVGNPEVPHTEHIKGEFVEYGAEHPHMNYYICSVCGEKFTDGTTTYVESCEVCNPISTNQPNIPSGHWSEWRAWSTTAVSASETRQVETRQVTTQEARTEYRYGRYVANGHDCWCATYLEKLPYVSGKAVLDYTGWSTTRYSANSKGWSCGNCSGNHIGVDHKTADGRPWWKEFVISGASYYWEESRVVPAQYQTQYRYRDWIFE